MEPDEGLTKLMVMAYALEECKHRVAIPRIVNIAPYKDPKIER